MEAGVNDGAGPDWLGWLPARILALDVEATGLRERDRIVSLGLVAVEAAALTGPAPPLRLCHLVFDPGRRSHARAEALHGYDDWTLRHQDPIDAHLPALAGLIEAADLVVAHNAAFDLGLLDRELARAGLPPLAVPRYCTWEAYRRRGEKGRESLAAVCARFGVARAGPRHGALEDAWLALRAYLWLQACPVDLPRLDGLTLPPANLRPVPPRPEGRLPPRSAGASVPVTVSGQ
ncbi:3'-5' exonuclease [Methylobacterium oryzihabitans]|uniref:3'-5' exonuclease n=1 Tax=Methylobacterium oryzihabitans TaxID=2499852 RepID=A0A437PCY6_9HYPH|nr:3'-5' exonuclease [Methylobacterium oryzihabitans]